ncbi:MAG: hypothetical protein M1840_001948 [Geoglossum simile]|nr:MAG: hypothetical protein M1840_001948 [Geoglossum simile]
MDPEHELNKNEFDARDVEVGVGGDDVDVNEFKVGIDVEANPVDTKADAVDARDKVDVNVGGVSIEVDGVKVRVDVGADVDVEVDLVGVDVNVKVRVDAVVDEIRAEVEVGELGAKPKGVYGGKDVDTDEKRALVVRCELGLDTLDSVEGVTVVISVVSLVVDVDDELTCHRSSIRGPS